MSVGQVSFGRKMQRQSVKMCHIWFAQEALKITKKVGDLVPEKFAEMQLPTQITHLVTENDAATIHFLIDFNH